MHPIGYKYPLIFSGDYDGANYAHFAIHRVFHIYMNLHFILSFLQYNTYKKSNEKKYPRYDIYVNLFYLLILNLKILKIIKNNTLSLAFPTYNFGANSLKLMK